MKRKTKRKKTKKKRGMKRYEIKTSTKKHSRKLNSNSKYIGGHRMCGPTPNAFRKRTDITPQNT